MSMLIHPPSACAPAVHALPPFAGLQPAPVEQPTVAPPTSPINRNLSAANLGVHALTIEQILNDEGNELLLRSNAEVSREPLVPLGSKRPYEAAMTCCPFPASASSMSSPGIDLRGR